MIRDHAKSRADHVHVDLVTWDGFRVIVTRGTSDFSARCHWQNTCTRGCEWLLCVKTWTMLHQPRFMKFSSLRVSPHHGKYAVPPLQHMNSTVVQTFYTVSWTIHAVVPLKIASVNAWTRVQCKARFDAVTCVSTCTTSARPHKIIACPRKIFACHSREHARLIESFSRVNSRESRKFRTLLLSGTVGVDGHTRSGHYTCIIITDITCDQSQCIGMHWMYM